MRGRWFVVGICIIGWLLVAGGALADEAGIVVPGDLRAEAEDGSGAVVTFVTSATDDEGNAIQVACTPESGARFPLGATLVTCTATYTPAGDGDDDGDPTTLEATFTVSVVDQTAPVIRTRDIAVEATSPAGAFVNYVLPAATDAVDPSPSVTCDPPSGIFPHGITAVSCTATDAAGNTGVASFNVHVLDTVGPSFSGGPEPVVTREANGPDGSVVTYPVPTATDTSASEPLPVTCIPAPGARFPLGETVARCHATDGRGNRSELTFAVVVKDTTAPTLAVPAPLAVTAGSAAGAPSTDAAVAAFLAGARASDLVTAAPALSHDAPPVLPVGTTRITFTATDAAGNASSASSAVTVFAPRASPAAPAAPPSVVPAAVPDRTPPGAVRSLRVVAGDRRVRLTWTLPADPDFDRVSIARSGAAADAQGAVAVYTGRGTTFEDRNVRNGIEYRYVVVGYDRDRNASASVAAVATPKARLLFAPLDGARVRKPPFLVWHRTPGAGYYNVQLFRGKTKIFSGWPTRSRLLLRESWRYGGKQQRLVPGTYRWYVWPGIGARREARYGEVLGQATFVRVRAAATS